MSNEDKDDAELATWRGEWQGLGGKDDLAGELVARAVRDGRRMRRSGAIEVLAAALSSSFCFWLMAHGKGSLENFALSGVILLFNGAWLTHFFTMRAELFRSSGEGLEAFVVLTRRRLAAEIRWTIAARRWTIALASALVPWDIWVFIAHKEAYFAEPWRGVIGYGGAVALFALIYAWSGRKNRTLRAEAEAFERHVADGQLA